MDELEIREPEDQPAQLCPACDDMFSHARTAVIVICGTVVSLTPPGLMFLSYWAAAHKVAWQMDDRLFVCCVGAIGTVMLYAFRGRAPKSGVQKDQS